MKWMIASDIHGSAKYCRMLLEAQRREKPDKTVLLGDLLYHGPRNDLPEEYSPKDVLAMLNEKKNYICVRGNCDTEVDQMVLDFPILADYLVLADGAQTVYVTHGHHYSEDSPLPLSEGEILLCGHTHVPALRKHEGYIYMNPGSVSIPKEGSWHGYMIWENGCFIWKDLEGREKMRYPD